MARELLRFDIVDTRGEEILDEAEGRSGLLPYLSSPQRRNYSTERREDFEATLNDIDSGWQQHLQRTP